ncbi:WD40 repeat domain-containing protein, partial [Streptomyces sp. NPDC014846]|uniref:WD40 repeat domain-containing protein n=1 Tax=Streptomyces sp. NPDC014846 TaxID=3364922 RepID=UPI0036F80BDD
MTPAPDDDSLQTEARITRRLLALAEEALTADHPDLPPYIRRHLAEHAHAADILDHAILNPRLLPYLDAGRVRIAVGPHDPHCPPGLWNALRHATHQWDFNRPARNAAALELNAAILAAPLTEPTTATGWRVHWASSNPRQGELLGHHAGVPAIAAVVLPDGRPLAMTGGSGERTVRLWDLSAGTQVGQPLPGHIGGVMSVAATVLPDGRPLGVTGDGDGTVRAWHLDTGQQIGKALAGHVGGVVSVAAVVLSNGRPLGIASGNDGTVRIWDLLSTRSIGRLPTGYPHGVPVAAVGLPDGRSVAATIYGGGTTPVVHVWNLETGWRIGKAPGLGGDASLAMTVLPDGRPIAVVGGPRRYSLTAAWDVNTGQRFSDPIVGHSNGVVAMAAVVLPDGRPIAVTGDGDGMVRVWDLTTGEQIGNALNSNAGGEAVSIAAVVLPEGRPLAVTGDGRGTVRVWDLDTIQQWREPSANQTSGGRNLNTWGRAFRPPSTHRSRNLRSVAALVLPDGRPLAVTGDGGGAVRVWDLNAGDQVGKDLNYWEASVIALAAVTLPDGPPLVLTREAGWIGVVRVRDLHTGEQIFYLPTPDADGATSVAAVVLPDNRAIALTGDGDGAVRVWDLTTGRQTTEPLTGHTG